MLKQHLSSQGKVRGGENSNGATKNACPTLTLEHINFG